MKNTFMFLISLILFNSNILYIFFIHKGGFLIILLTWLLLLCFFTVTFNVKNYSRFSFNLLTTLQTVKLPSLLLKVRESTFTCLTHLLLLTEMRGFNWSLLRCLKIEWLKQFLFPIFYFLFEKVNLSISLSMSHSFPFDQIWFADDVFILGC